MLPTQPNPTQPKPIPTIPPSTQLAKHTLARSLISRTSATTTTQTFPNQPTNQPTFLTPVPPDPVHPSASSSSSSLPPSVVTPLISLHTHRAWMVPKLSAQTHLGPRFLFRPQPITAAGSSHVHPFIGHRTRRTDGARSVRAAGSGQRAAGTDGEGGRRKAGEMDGWAFESVGFYFIFIFFFWGGAGRVSWSVGSTGEYMRVCVVCGRVEKRKGG
ncbi:hypothetical protein IWZ03DRAFT_147301 [Phyllosticta citriasiana]|uniref:Uncharacterized protein n=1 Tax=Phyllosticta citriasiana TaxID=595635 RepID=A0ABR1KNI7_9PEZI